MMGCGEKVMFCCNCVLYIWQERHGRIFREDDRNWEVLLEIICDTVKTKLLVLKFINTMAVAQMTALWNVNFDIQKNNLI